MVYHYKEVRKRLGCRGNERGQEVGWDYKTANPVASDTSPTKDVPMKVPKPS